MNPKPSFLHQLVFLQFGVFAILLTLLSGGIFILLQTDFWFPGWLWEGGFWKGGSMLRNVLLVFGFGLQHSVMARKGFKRFLSTWMPPEVERNVYVMWSGFFLLMIGALWHREPTLWYDLRGTVPGGLLIFWSSLGWLLVVVAACSIDALDLIGARQLIANLRGRPIPETPFRVPLVYRFVRHPLYLGFLMAFWCSPCMTPDSLLFAVCITVYLFIGIWFEEKDLVNRYGDVYKLYARQVPMIIPQPGRFYKP